MEVSNLHPCIRRKQRMPQTLLCLLHLPKKYSLYIDGMKLSYDKNRVGIYLIYTFSLNQSRGVPSGSSSRSRSACNSLHTSTILRKGKVSFVKSKKSRGHQHVVHWNCNGPCINTWIWKCCKQCMQVLVIIVDGLCHLVGKPFVILSETANSSTVHLYLVACLYSFISDAEKACNNAASTFGMRPFSRASATGIGTGPVSTLGSGSVSSNACRFL